MVSPSEFVDGADVEWARLARTLVGATFGAIFTGWASIVLAGADVVLRPLEWLGGFLGSLVDVLVGIPARYVALSWAGPLELIEGSGPLGFVLAVAIVLLTLYVAVRVVNRA